MYNRITTDVNEMFRVLSTDMADISLRKKIYRNSVTPVVAGTMFGAGGALATGEPENFAIVGGSVLAGLSFGQAATKALIRAGNAKEGKDFIRSKTKEDEWTGFINELKETDYIVIDSRYRDFDLYTNQCNFVIKLETQVP